jgi:hypothetical protein
MLIFAGWHYAVTKQAVKSGTMLAVGSYAKGVLSATDNIRILTGGPVVPAIAVRRCGPSVPSAPL